MTCNTLAEAILNQFIETVVNDKQFLRCLECQNWMTKGRKIKERKNYCSTQCRSRAYNRRSRLAESKQVIETLKSLKSSIKIKKEFLLRRKNKENDETNFRIFIDLIAPNLKKEKDRICFNDLLDNAFKNFHNDLQQATLCDHLGVSIDISNNLMSYFKIIQQEFMPTYNSFYKDWDIN